MESDISQAHSIRCQVLQQATQRQHGRLSIIFHTVTWYYIFVALIFSGIVYLNLTTDVFQLVVVGTVGWVYAQMGLGLGHMTVHAWFMEISDVNKMLAGALVAYYHHYANVRALSDHWLEHRLGFLPAPFEVNGFGTYIAVVGLYLVYGWSAIGIMAYTGFFVVVLAALHEWYHLDKRRRREHHWRFTNFAFEVLEFFGAANSREHCSIHHSHSHQSRSDVQDFFVTSTFGLSALSNLVWNWSLQFHTEGKMNRTHGFTLAFLLLTPGVLVPSVHLANRVCSIMQGEIVDDASQIQIWSSDIWTASQGSLLHRMCLVMSGLLIYFFCTLIAYATLVGFSLTLVHWFSYSLNGRKFSSS